MDALALLCTLHADGPTTLKRLRELDCSSLKELYSLDLASLAWALEGEQGAARRFLQEGLILLERIDVEEFDGEESPESDAQEAEPAPLELHPKRAGARTSPSTVSILPTSFFEAAGFTKARSETQQVHAPGSGTVRTSGRPAGNAAGAQAPKTRTPELGSELPGDCVASNPAAAAHAVETPRLGAAPIAAVSPPAPASPDAPRKHQPLPAAQKAPQVAAQPRTEARTRMDLSLREGLIEGLDQDVCRALSSAGVLTLVELADSANLQLARRLGLPFAKLLELELLAQRLLKSPRLGEQATHAERKATLPQQPELGRHRPSGPEQKLPSQEPSKTSLAPKVAPTKPREDQPELPEPRSLIVPISSRPEHLPARRFADRREPFPRAKPDEPKPSHDLRESGSAGPFA